MVDLQFGGKLKWNIGIKWVKYERATFLSIVFHLSYNKVSHPSSVIIFKIEHLVHLNEDRAAKLAYEKVGKL